MAAVPGSAGRIAPLQARLGSATARVVAGDAPAHQVVLCILTALAAGDNVVRHDAAATAPGRGADRMPPDALGAHRSPLRGAVEGIAHAASIARARARSSLASVCLSMWNCSGSRCDGDRRATRSAKSAITPAIGRAARGWEHGNTPIGECSRCSRPPRSLPREQKRKCSRLFLMFPPHRLATRSEPLPLPPWPQGAHQAAPRQRA